MWGHHPIYMDTLGRNGTFGLSEAQRDDARAAMGQTRRFAERMDLAAMMPSTETASTRYCLAAPGRE